MGCRCAPTAATGSRGSYRRIRSDHAAEARSASQAKLTRAARGRGADRRHPRQHHHRRGLFDLHLGAPVGQEDCPVQPRHAGGRPQTPNAKPPAGSCLAPAPDPPRFPSIASAGRGCRKPSPSAPMTAHTAGCTVTVTSSPPSWRPASTSPTPTIRALRGSITDLPTPCGRGWPPSKSGRVQSTGTSHRHHQMLGSARTGSHHPVASAEQAALGLPPNSPGTAPGRRGSSRKQPAPKLIGAA